MRPGFFAPPATGPHDMRPLQSKLRTVIPAINTDRGGRDCRNPGTLFLIYFQRIMKKRITHLSRLIGSGFRRAPERRLKTKGGRNAGSSLRAFQPPLRAVRVAPLPQDRRTGGFPLRFNSEGRENQPILQISQSSPSVSRFPRASRRFFQAPRGCPRFGRRRAQNPRKSSS